MIAWRRLDEKTVIRAWAIAEATSHKQNLAKAIAASAAPELQEKIRAGRHETLTDAEWRALENYIIQDRAPLLKDLLALRVEW